MNFSSLPLKPAQYLPYLTIGLIAILLSIIFSGENKEWLTFNTTQTIAEPYAFLQQSWSIFTRHFIHTNIPHLVINLFGLFLIWMLYGDYFTQKHAVRKFVFLLMMICLGTSLLTLGFSVTDSRFIGLSGVLHGLFAWGGVQDIRFKIKTGYLLLIGLILKLGQEQFFENTAFMANVINADVAVDSHLYGALTGFIMGLVLVGRVKN